MYQDELKIRSGSSKSAAISSENYDKIGEMFNHYTKENVSEVTYKEAIKFIKETMKISEHVKVIIYGYSEEFGKESCKEVSKQVICEYKTAKNILQSCSIDKDDKSVINIGVMVNIIKEIKMVHDTQGAKQEVDEQINNQEIQTSAIQQKFKSHHLSDLVRRYV